MGDVAKVDKNKDLAKLNDVAAKGQEFLAALKEVNPLELAQAAPELMPVIMGALNAVLKTVETIAADPRVKSAAQEAKAAAQKEADEQAKKLSMYR